MESYIHKKKEYIYIKKTKSTLMANKILISFVSYGKRSMQSLVKEYVRELRVQTTFNKI